MSISLIIPIFNEATNLQKGVLDKIGNFTKNDPRFLEVVIADDGSTDETCQIIHREYLPHFPKFRLLTLPHGGKANTVIAATKDARGEFVFMTDADLATPIEEANKLIEKQIESHAQIVIGSRGIRRPEAPLTRTVLALGMVILRTTLFGLRGIKDTQCGFKLYHRASALKIFDNLLVFKRKTVGTQASVSAIFDLEFLFLAKKMGYDIREVRVFWRHVETRRVSFVKDMVESLTDMARLKWYDIRGLYN
jgi:glycosyltransferase involved in cell wall biosynthesis